MPGLQNRQGGAALRLDGSIPSPLRGEKVLHLGRFSLTTDDLSARRVEAATGDIALRGRF